MLKQVLSAAVRLVGLGPAACKSPFCAFATPCHACSWPAMRVGTGLQRAAPSRKTHLPAFLACRLENCELAAVPPFLSALTSLTSLTLERCELQDPGASYGTLATLAALPRLQELGLEACGLPQAAVYTKQLSHLTRLDLCWNGLCALPPGPYLSHLTALHLAGFAFRRPAAALAGLASCLRLRRLALWAPEGGCRCGTVPHSVVGLEGLTALALNSLGLKQLPEGPYLLSLRALDLALNEVGPRRLRAH
jgi:hypothetical protein